ncbi:unnamed protein product [Rotaria sordida]|uniref:Uncharacterized protein n=1 Tax=Rotaria sordida TaxID=392033 RepID=A0A814UBP0_9BILA|nr:unnamed protein product [Rotaria sordida]CAF1090362.1 unnamed protein product [Rotaria sordida]CAF1171855.1 unnamed protein product [Rotaria sordida]CAF1417628.1 unnamed protein product [Rotaria sordida]CAF3642721.1 unnamed protein product [Rotaria sordida]
MGACAGKNKSKKSKSYEPTTDSTTESEAKPKDKNLQPNMSPSPTETLSSSKGFTVNNDDHSKSTLNTETHGIDPDVQIGINEQGEISNTLSKPFPHRVISVNDAELETELANLVYGRPENDYAENPIVVTTIKSTEV